MRITFLGTSSLDYPSPRGRWLPLAQELVKLGHEPRLLLLHHTYDRLPRALRCQRIGGVQVEYVGQMHVYGAVGQRQYFRPGKLLQISLRGTLALARAALLARGEIVHVCKPQPINGLAGLLASRAGRSQLYVDCDDYEAGGNRFSAQWQQALVRSSEDRLPQLARGVTVNTRFLQGRNLDLGIAPDRIVYVPNGVADAQPVPVEPRTVDALRSALGLGAAPVVMYVGTLSRTTHNVELLLEAFAHVRRTVPKARLVLVGAGEDGSDLRTRARELGIGDAAAFVGAVAREQVPAFLALADCSVDPVVDDGVARGRSPLKIVESLAAGVPVVTGAVGDRPEMLGAGGGVLVAPGDAAALADGIAGVLADTGRRAQLAAAARERARSYRWSELAREWIKVYS